MKFTTRFFTQGLLCLFICFLSTTAIHGQNNDFQHKKDSLLKVIESTKGEKKLKAYSQLICTPFSDETIKLQYINDFIREARKQENKKYESVAYRCELVYLWNNLRNDEYEQKANEYLPFFKKNDSSEYYYDIYESLATLLVTNGNYDHAMEVAKQIYAEAKQEECLYGISKATSLMAKFYLVEKRYEDAEKYYKETLENALKLIKKKSGQAKDYHLAENYHLVSRAYKDLEITLAYQNKLNERLALMPVWKKHSRNFEETFGDPDFNLMHYYRAYSRIYIEKEEYDKAELYCDSMVPITPHLALNYIYGLKVSICEGRKEYNSAIDWINKGIEHLTNRGELSATVELLKDKGRILGKMGQLEESYSVFSLAFQRNDSLRLAENNAQLDEIRTQYEVDKHIAEKKLEHSYFLFALSGCMLLTIALGIWIHYSRKVTKKNRQLAQQIKEMAAQQENLIKETLEKTSFIPYFPNETTSIAAETTIDPDLCVESRMDKLCVAIRDLLLKDKIYRNPTITQEAMIKKLGTNRKTFDKAMDYCFNMSFSDYVNILRLKDAVQLLEQSDLLIEEISEKVGFGTAQTFRNQFSAKYNMNPKDYRNLIKTAEVIWPMPNVVSNTERNLLPK
ncbi:MAG: AraC family transcriptional regulator [Dysgonamonadaceae bacterium]|jgi:AraC-like DNA-binding protein|nr:AraC family transcriptional regulator [Dysgonamonadaceae bacterium]